uniref:Putative secreted protein n=1 Tax=Ixodes ricinus TaxID=34613 RepID=A0A6B0U4N6_IXORI
MSHGLRAVCPPVTLVPASAAASLNPLTRSGTTMSRSLSLSLLLTASTSRMLSQSVTPWAYRPLSTLAQAILPIT